MELIGPKYIGSKISIQALKDFILDNDITENDTIVLNRKDFDDMVLEHRRLYNVGISIPYHLHHVLIDEDVSDAIPVDRVMIIKDHDRDEQTERMRIIDMPETEPDKNEIIYRCGWCGNVVDINGNEFGGKERLAKIQLLEKYNNEVVRVNGMCCVDKWST